LKAFLLRRKPDMSHTDQAFIKAYQPPGDDPRPTRKRTRKADAHLAADHETTPAAQVTAAQVTAAETHAPESVSSDSVVPRPHFLRESLPSTKTRSKSSSRKSAAGSSRETLVEFATPAEPESESAAAKDSAPATQRNEPVAKGQVAKGPVAKGPVAKGPVAPNELLTEAETEVLNTGKASQGGIGSLAKLTNSGTLREAVQPQTQLNRLPLPALCEVLLAHRGEEFRALAEQIRLQTQEGLRLLLVAGCQPHDGCTTVALCLTRALTQAGLRVALVDGDFQRPGIAAQLGLTLPADWLDVLQGQVSLGEALQEVSTEGIAILPLRPDVPTPLQWGNEPRLRLSLGLLRRDYDLVLIDNGPLGPDSARPTGWPQIDSALVVQGPESRAADRLPAVEEQLHAAGISILGIAENFSEDDDDARPSNADAA